MHHTLSSLLILPCGVAAATMGRLWPNISQLAPTSPVCVVGAGPAGLRAARALEDKGRAVVMFEKQEAVGGKCQAYYDGPNGDTFHPLGALLLENTTYVETGKVIAQTNVPYLVTSGLGPKWSYHWRTGEIGPYPTLTAQQQEVLRGEFERYVSFWNTSYAPISAVGYRSPIPAELTVSVAEWCAQNDYLVLPAVFNLGMFPYGYGDLRETPIWYMLAYFTPSIVGAFLGNNGENLIDFHAVMAEYSKTIKGPIHTNASIARISRSGDRTCVNYSTGGDYMQSRTQECSELILAFPPTVDALAAAGLDVSDEEEDLFGAVQLINYFSGAVSMAVPAGDLYYANSTSAAVPPAAEGEPVGFIRLFPDSDVVTTWSWGARNATYTEAQGKRVLLETLSRTNKPAPGDAASAAVAVTAADVHAFRRHDYFPHVGGAALAGGWYARFDALQGRQRTYYASGLNGFEMVEYALRAGKDVVDTYL